MTIPSALLRPLAAPLRSDEGVWTPVPGEVEARLGRQIEQLRAVIPSAGPARALLQRELERLEAYQAQLVRTGNLVQLPHGTDPRSIVRPSPALKAELARVRDQTLEGLRAKLGDPHRWYGGRVPALVSDGLARAQGARDVEALLSRADVRKALLAMTDFGYEPAREWSDLRAALDAANRAFGLAL